MSPPQKSQQLQGVGAGLRAELLSQVPLTEHHLELAGIPTAVMQGGDGPPMILLHGQGGFAAVWNRVIPELAASHRLVVPDLPGHGASGLGPRPLEDEQVLGWLGELIDQTCSAPPVLVGHLLGGAIAARFATAYGDRIDHLVLVDSFGLARFRPAASFALAMVGFVARPTEGSRDRLFNRCFVDYDRLRADMGDRWPPMGAYALDRARTPNLKKALRQLMPRFVMSPIPPEELAGITVPTTLIWGRHDLQVRLSVAEEASARYGWPLHVIEGAADDPAAEQPGALVRVLTEILQEEES